MIGRPTVVRSGNASPLGVPEGGVASAIRQGTVFPILFTSAEKGAVWTMLKPEYSVFVPKGARAQVPLVIALPVDAPELEKLLKTWVPLKKDDGTLAELHAHWVLGEKWQRKDARWSIIKDVLHWVD